MNIQNLTDDVLCAYLDGELSPEAHAALERQLLSEPGARVRLDRLRESDDRLRRAFALPSAAATDPLVRLLTADASVAENAVPLRASRLRRIAAPLGLALAATLAGLAIGFWLRGAVDAPAEETTASGLAIAKDLHDALDRNISGRPRAGVTLLFTFRRQDGAPCRQFEFAHAAVAAEGVACRGADRRWRISAWHALPNEIDGYRTAGDESPIEAVVDALDASGPLPPAEEAALIAKGW
jgi:hypothetical protein